MGCWTPLPWKPDLRLLASLFSLSWSSPVVDYSADTHRFDASGFIVEHYSDGDLVNCHTKFSRVAASPRTMRLWGPLPSRAFMKGRMEDPEEAPTMSEIRQEAVAA